MAPRILVVTLLLLALQLGAEARAVELPPNIDDLRCASLTSSDDSAWRRLDGRVAGVMAETGVPSNIAHRARKVLDDSEPALQQVFGLPAAAHPLSVCLVAERRSVSAAPGMNADPRVAGAAITGARLALVAIDAPGDFDRIVLHEVAHLLAAEKARSEGERALPMWMSEGIAEAVAAHALGSTGELHTAMRRLGDRPTLRELQLGLREGAAAAEVQQFYVASASATSFMAETKGWERVWTMLRVSGKLPANLEEDWHSTLAR